MQAAKDAGYKVNLVYVGVDDPSVSLGRVADRVSKGGHDVPTEAIERRYELSLKNLPKAAAIADYVAVYDNSRSTRQLIAERENGQERQHAPMPAWAARALAPVERQPERDQASQGRAPAETIEDRLSRAGQGARADQGRPAVLEPRGEDLNPAQRLYRDAQAAIARVQATVTAARDQMTRDEAGPKPAPGSDAERERAQRWTALAKESREALTDARGKIETVRNLIVGPQMGEIHEGTRQRLDRNEDAERALRAREKALDSQAAERTDKPGVISRVTAFLKGEDPQRQETQREKDRANLADALKQNADERKKLKAMSLPYTHSVDRKEIGPVEAKAYEIIGDRAPVGVKGSDMKNLRVQVIQATKDVRDIEGRSEGTTISHERTVQTQALGKTRTRDRDQGQER